MNRAKILGTGSAVPKKLLTNADLEKLVDTSDTWIRERTGIRERHIVSPGEKFSDLCTDASAAALKRAKVKPEEKLDVANLRRDARSRAGAAARA